MHNSLSRESCSVQARTEARSIRTPRKAAQYHPDGNDEPPAPNPLKPAPAPLSPALCSPVSAPLSVLQPLPGESDKPPTTSTTQLPTACTQRTQPAHSLQTRHTE